MVKTLGGEASAKSFDFLVIEQNIDHSLPFLVSSFMGDPNTWQHGSDCPANKNPCIVIIGDGKEKPPGSTFDCSAN